VECDGGVGLGKSGEPSAGVVTVTQSFGKLRNTTLPSSLARSILLNHHMGVDLDRAKVDRSRVSYIISYDHANVFILCFTLQVVES